MVGKFSGIYAQSGVASGSQLFNMITMVITGLTMGIIVFLGECIGSKNREKAGIVVGNGVVIFSILAIVITF
ncbi:MATE family efflux transporter [Candidatus Arthromitus sp. SFB-mouse-NL]|uniref:MATE family efflux transporter n=1 Tax=Candidatus Arthromitus sp. SFB-mouse-NL TaxID=1508644 RepID=UPI001FA6F3E7|nr:MATE family efflux transporter [Candidatus Arthromitus sp. SFB-mouse-NL]